jgi:hypothetical protein
LNRNAILVASCLLFLTACGGAGRSTSPQNTATQAPMSPPSFQANVVGPPPGERVAINVVAGQITGGVDITVPAARAATPPNAQLLGTGSVNGGGTASNTGATIRRGERLRVLVFGPGLDANTTATISGPADITISNLAPINSTSGATGISFVAEVNSSAALGARTVVLQTPEGDISTFTGGLEVIP